MATIDNHSKIAHSGLFSLKNCVCAGVVLGTAFFLWYTASFEACTRGKVVAKMMLNRIENITCEVMVNSITNNTHASQAISLLSKIQQCLPFCK